MVMFMSNNKRNTFICKDLVEGRFSYTLFTQKGFDKEMYGIEIKDLQNKTESKILEITSIEKDAHIMYNIIKDNIVHPIHLNDVVYDLITM